MRVKRRGVASGGLTREREGGEREGKGRGEPN
jgi:hypothetical protein